ncbi:MAG: glucose-6-phosphate isomerase [Proteobacteria bacterium]|nr:glucose-6-phosphate isomerase [Pseudomonadota bacterium]
MQQCIRFESRFVPAELKSSAESLHAEALLNLQAIRGGTCAGGEWTGWFDYPARTGWPVLDSIEDFIRKNDTFFDLVIVVGIGGSFAGTKAVSDALNHSFVHALPRAARVPVVFAGHNLSEAGLLELIDLCDRRQPMINVISKSGTTTEPGVAFRILRSYLEKRFGEREAARRIVVTTDSKRGALRALAREKSYRAFEIPDDIGGRFSVLTPVGVLPLAFAGFDVRAMLNGAESVFADMRVDLVAGRLKGAGAAAIEYSCLRRASWEAGKRIEVMNVADPKLSGYVEWWKQLFGESEGKGGLGLFPAGFLSSTDLHSMGQYLQDGPRNLIETFLMFDEPTARSSIERRLAIPSQSGNADELGYLEGRHVEDLNAAVTQASQLAHADGGVPVFEIRANRLDEFNLGALFAFHETVCAISALLLGVNPFDQPGVEDYKKNLFALLGKPGHESLGASLRGRLGR